MIFPAELPRGDLTAALPCAYGGPLGSADLKERPEDFVVEEWLGYEPTGAGEHVILRIRKRNLNTHEVAGRLAALAGVSPAAVGYAGRKDRVAVTTQSFSVHLPGRLEPDWSRVADDDLSILGVDRHHRKLRRGALRGNRFRLRLRGVQADWSGVAERIDVLARRGVPNYFGAQRFGRQGQNLARAAERFAGRRRFNRNQLNLALSAARAWLFNRVLGHRVRLGNWDRVIEGDVLQLDGTRRLFSPGPDDPDITRRLAELDVHPTGPLVGKPGRAPVPSAAAGALEQAELEDAGFWVSGLSDEGLEAGRRALRLRVLDLEWERIGNDLTLGFGLTAGAYATVVLRELVAPRVPDENPVDEGDA